MVSGVRARLSPHRLSEHAPGDSFQLLAGRRGFPKRAVALHVAAIQRRGITFPDVME